MPESLLLNLHYSSHAAKHMAHYMLMPEPIGWPCTSAHPLSTVLYILCLCLGVAFTTKLSVSTLYNNVMLFTGILPASSSQPSFQLIFTYPFESHKWFICYIIYFQARINLLLAGTEIEIVLSNMLLKCNVITVSVTHRRKQDPEDNEIIQAFKMLLFKSCLYKEVGLPIWLSFWCIIQ